MGAARSVGGPELRAHAAFAAGCDMVLLCNDPEAADALLARFGTPPVPPGAAQRLAALQARPVADGEAAYRLALTQLDRLGLEGWSAAE